MPRVRLAPGVDESGGEAAAQIGFEREDDLGLRAIAFEHHRKRLLDVRQCRIEDLRLDAARQRLLANIDEPVGKRGTGLG